MSFLPFLKLNSIPFVDIPHLLILSSVGGGGGTLGGFHGVAMGNKVAVDLGVLLHSELT